LQALKYLNAYFADSRNAVISEHRKLIDGSARNMSMVPAAVVARHKTRVQQELIYGTSTEQTNRIRSE
jgi:hypothetical protein